MILGQVNDSLLQECQQQLQGEDVSMALDGWSNVHNEPIVCACVTTVDGRTYPIKTINTSGQSHTAAFVYKIAKDAI